MAEESGGFGPSEVDGGNSRFRVEHYFSVGSTEGEAMPKSVGSEQVSFRKVFWPSLWLALKFTVLAAAISGGLYWLFWRAAVRDG